MISCPIADRLECPYVKDKKTDANFEEDLFKLRKMVFAIEIALKNNTL